MGILRNSNNEESTIRDAATFQVQTFHKVKNLVKIMLISLSNILRMAD
jgi:hypothetical protein